MSKLLHLPTTPPPATSPQQAEPLPRRVNPFPLAFSLALGSLRVSWSVRTVKRRGRLALILTASRHILRAWRLARRAWL